MVRLNYKKEGNMFHKRMERMLKKLLPTKIKSEYHKVGPDIILRLETFKIIVQCKHSPKQKVFVGLDNLIDSYSRKVQKQNADVAILAFSGYKIPEQYKRSKLMILKKDKVALWTEPIIKGYDKLINSIGEYAKYQILGDLNLSKGNNSIIVKALTIKQKKMSYYVINLSPNFLLKCSYVARRIDNSKTYQRLIARVRVKRDIPRYLEDGSGLFPNAIILVSDYSLQPSKNNKLKLFERPASLRILDGQHRLYAFANIKNLNLRKGYDLICVLFDGTSKKLPAGEQANLFTVINNESKKVPLSLLMELSKSFEEIHAHKREIKILTELEKISAFKGRFKSYQEIGGDISKPTFCTNQAMQQLIRENTGLIMKNTSGHSTESYQIKRCINYLKTYFSQIAKIFKKEWNNSDKYILCTDRGIRALLYLFIKILKYNKYKLDKKSIQTVLKIIKSKPFEFRNDKLKKKYLGEGGASDFADNLATLVNEDLIDFDLTISKQYGEILENVEFKKGQKDEARTFIKQRANKYFEDRIYAKLMHIDETTFDLLNDSFSHCKTMWIIFQDMNNKKKCAERLKKMRSKGISIILTKKKNHERWIATYKYLLELGTDLKEDAICNNDHRKRIYRLGPHDPTIKEFNQLWHFAKENTTEEIIYDYDPEKPISKSEVITVPPA